MLHKKEKIIIDTEIEYLGPKILVFLYKYSFAYDNVFSFLTGIIHFFTKLLTGRTLEEKKYVIIYKKASLLKKQLLYREKVPNRVNEQELMKKIYHLEQAYQNGKIENLISRFINEEEKIFK